MVGDSKSRYVEGGSTDAMLLIRPEDQQKVRYPNRSIKWGLGVMNNLNSNHLHEYCWNLFMEPDFPGQGHLYKVGCPSTLIA